MGIDETELFDECLAIGATHPRTAVVKAYGEGRLAGIADTKRAYKAKIGGLLGDAIASYRDGEYKTCGKALADIAKLLD